MVNQAVEQEITRLAEALDMTPEAVRKHVTDKMTERGISDLNAIREVKMENKGLLQRIQGTYRIFPLVIGDKRMQALKDRDTGEEKDHTVVDVIGIFYGPTTRGGQPKGFLHSLSLWDEAVGKEDVLRDGQGPFVFKGAVDTFKNKIYLSRTGEFAVDKSSKTPPFTTIMAEVRQNLLPLSRLMDTNNKGDLIYQDQAVGFEAEVAEVVDFQSGKQGINVTDLGADIYLVWPPEGMEFTEANVGQRVIIYGVMRVNDRGVSINARVMVAVE